MDMITSMKMIHRIQANQLWIVAINYLKEVKNISVLANLKTCVTLKIQKKVENLIQMLFLEVVIRKLNL